MNKKLVVGFDGFVDRLVRVVKESGASYYDTIGDFGRYITGQENKSCSIQIDLHNRKHGGNAPLLSTAAAHLGLDVTCIGMMGYPTLDPIFAPLAFNKISYMPPGESLALEFNDGKVFIAEGIQLDDPWARIEAASNGTVSTLYDEADAIALVNWSEVTFAQDLWEKVYASLTTIRPRHILFDLCDTTRKTQAETLDILALIGRFGEKGNTILSLNENECLDVGKKIGINPDCEAIARALRATYNIHEVLVHATKWSFLTTRTGELRQDTTYVAQPKVSTGAGDNFNASYLYAATQGMGMNARIRFAHDFVHGYISTGGY